jgi:hypothetical protein
VQDCCCFPELVPLSVQQLLQLQCYLLWERDYDQQIFEDNENYLLK